MSGTPPRLRVGISACFFHPDPERPVFKNKTLLYLEQSMAHWVQGGGALTYLVPTLDAAAAPAPGAADVAADLDALLLHGGADVCPRTYGEEPLQPDWEGDEVRDRYEIELVRAFDAAGKPVLGICRGAQLLNVAFGGTLYQDISTQVATERVHRTWELYDANEHEVDLVEGSALAELYPGRRRVRVNSIHHQAVKDMAPGFVVEARSADDGVVEALRRPEGGFVAGVQWHPEFMDGTRPDVLDNDPIRDQFLRAAAERRDDPTRRP